MNLRPKAADDVDINLTPMIDVVFLLLIFFMVSTTFVHESEIDLTLPEASKNANPDTIDKIDVAIDKEGQLFVNGVALVNRRVESIKRALRDARPEGVEPVVVISADAQASHQMVISVMDAARQIGLYRITFPINVSNDNDAD